MKKIVLLLALSLGILVSQAQTSLTGANSLSIDTVTNTATKTMTGKVSGYQGTVTIQVDVTKISGTLAGTLTPIASNDGTTFYSVASRTSRDTAVTVTDVSAQGYNFSMPGGYLYYGVKWAGSGTMSGSFKATLIARKP